MTVRRMRGTRDGAEIHPRSTRDPPEIHPRSTRAPSHCPTLFRHNHPSIPRSLCRAVPGRLAHVQGQGHMCQSGRGTCANLQGHMCQSSGAHVQGQGHMCQSSGAHVQGQGHMCQSAGAHARLQSEVEIMGPEEFAWVGA